MPLINLYINAPTFALATGVFIDAALTTPAANGYYSDGTIVRLLTAGVLAPATTCETCGVPCGESISASGGAGIYNLSINTGSLPGNVGAIIIKFNPQNVPDGISVVYDGVTYNALSSPYFGFLQSGITTSGPTYVGSSASAGGCSWYPSGGIVTDVNVYEYDGTSFVDTGNNSNINVGASEIQLTASAPGQCIMVIPKTSPTPQVIDIIVFGLCGGTSWDIEIACPAMLPSFNSTDVGEAEPSGYPCVADKTNTYYFAKVHTAADTYVGLYDWVFSDPYGENVLPDGWYSIDNLTPGLNSIQVENGVVVDRIDKCY
jgi:hypothetical protein